MSSPVEDQSSPTADDSHHAGQGDDQMFGDDSDNDEKLSVHDSGEESEVGSRKRKRTTNGSMMEADRDEGKGIGGGGDGDTDEDGDGVKEEEILDELDEELFGDEEEESGDGKKLQILDNDELVSEREESPEEPILKREAEISLGRYTVLDPGTSGHLYLMKVPQYLPIIPELFDADAFTIPKPSPSQPSPYTLATTAIRFRQHPTEPGKYQSNSRIIRWSDGSLSLQIGSSPDLYDLPSKPLAPPPESSDYDPNQDSHTYLVTSHEGSNMLRFIGHATQSLAVMPAGEDVSDEAMARLHEQLAAAVNAKGGVRVKSMELQTMEDPEKLKREAEKIEKERVRAQKRLEAQRRKHDILPDRGSLSRSGGAGSAGRLSAADVEERKRDRRAGGRGTSPTTRRGTTREDEYDRADGFVADEDDDGDDFIVDDEDGDDRMDERDYEEAERRARAKLKKAKDKTTSGTPKKAPPRPLLKEAELDDDEEEEAEFTEESEGERREKRKMPSPGKEDRHRDGLGDEDDDDDDDDRAPSGGAAGGAAARKRRRYVVGDDDED